MKCARAYDADLLAVLRGESGDLEFLAHYPTCTDCAAELRVWGELDGLLRAGTPAGGGHPEPEALLAFVDASAGGATSSEHEAVGRHVAACRVCADEIASLRHFDAARAAPHSVPGRSSRAELGQSSRAEPGPSSRAAPARSPRAAAPLAPPRGRVARVLWHPAFAYGLAALLLVPLVREQVGHLAVPARMSEARRQEQIAEAPAVPAQPAGRPEPSSFDVAAPVRAQRADTGAGAARLAPSQPAEAPAVERDGSAMAPAAPTMVPTGPTTTQPPVARLRQAPPEAHAPGTAANAAPAAKAAANDADVERGREEFAVGLLAGRGHDGAAPAAALPPPAPAAVPGRGGAGPVVDLHAGRATVLAFELAESGPTLVLAAPGGNDDAVEVQIRARSGMRELVQRLTRRANAIAVPIPPHWLAEGDYTVTVAAFPTILADGADTAAAERRAGAPLTYDLTVRAR